jgi:2-polyprenyl-3-methyl-5-hydroxy-6-metoxy-1,4-benzoquinol methylase
MLGNKELSCICSSPDFEVIFTCSKPPEGEINFTFSQKKKYFRQLLRCRTCGHFRSIHDMSDGDIYSGEYVRANYQNLTGLRKTFDKIVTLEPSRSDNEGRVNRIISFLKKSFPDKNRNNTSVLDIGSGLGVFPYRMKRAGWNITALDPDFRACEHMRKLGLYVIQGTFQDAKIDALYDLITFNKVVEHVGKPIEFLKQSNKVLINTGIVYVEVPDGTKASEKGYHREEFFIDHMHIFSARSLSILMKRAGFLEIEQQNLKEPSGKYTLHSFGKKFNSAGTSRL